MKFFAYFVELSVTFNKIVLQLQSKKMRLSAKKAATLAEHY